MCYLRLMFTRTCDGQAGRLPVRWVTMMAIEKIISRASRGDDTQFECHVDKEIWVVSLHFDAALIASRSSRCLYRSKGGDRHIGGDHGMGWEFRSEEKGRHWKVVTNPALVNLLDCLHFACLRKDETESAAPQSRRSRREGELSTLPIETLEPQSFRQPNRCASYAEGFGKL